MDWIFLTIFAAAAAAVILQRRGVPGMQTFSIIAGLALIYTLPWIIWATLLEFDVVNIQESDLRHHWNIWGFVLTHQIFHFQGWNPGRDYSALFWIESFVTFGPPSVLIIALLIGIRNRRPQVNRRLAYFAVIAGIVQFAIMSFFSWWGDLGGDGNSPHPSRIIRLGWQPNPETAVRLALSRTAAALIDDPRLQLIEVRWTDSFLFGFPSEDQGSLVYDRVGSELMEVNAGEQKGNDPDEDWKPVDENVIQALAQRGFFDEKLLQDSGCQSTLP